MMSKKMVQQMKNKTSNHHISKTRASKGLAKSKGKSKDRKIATASRSNQWTAPLTVALTAQPSQDFYQRYSTHGYLNVGLWLLLLLIGGFGGWATLTEINSAIIATGELRSIHNRQLVQHAEGGILKTILVKDGDNVKAGQTLLRLSQQDIAIERSVFISRLLQTDARIARLVAERNGLPSVIEPAIDKVLAEDAIVRNPYFEGQQQLFTARQTLFAKQLAQLDVNIGAKHDQIKATHQQIERKRKQLVLTTSELTEVKTLIDSGYVEKSRVVGLEREEARIDSELAQFEAALAVAQGETASLIQEKLRLQSERQEIAITELRELELNRDELVDNLRLNRERLRRTIISAPVSGIVTGLALHTEGGVVQPGQVLMTITPAHSELVIEAQISLDAIDEVRVGQRTGVLLTALSSSNLHEFDGVITHVSADRFETQATSAPGGEGSASVAPASYYIAEIALTTKALQQLQVLGIELVSGMPVEVHAQTGARSPWSYLTKPLREQINRAFRES